ncbi:MAG: DMT family transporter, partial [Verrucomicrobiae bacterium]|nr:DMT family transporter [Verrucomicrobiae bacterium]
MNRPAGGAESIAFLALLAGAVCIGLAPAWVRWSEVGPVATAFYRLALALPILGLWARRERARVAPAGPGPSFRNWVIAAGTCFALDLGAWHLSIQWTSVANATLLANFAPMVVTLGAWWFLGERVGTRFFAGMFIALTGAWLLTGAGFQANPGRLI